MSNAITSLSSGRFQESLTPSQRRMYASERLMNYRTITRLLGTRSRYVLTPSDLVPEALQIELGRLGQFAEVAYAMLDPEFVFTNLDTLTRTDFPFEGYDGLQETNLVSSFRGTVADVPGLVAYRVRTRQLIVAFSGTASVKQTLYDLNAIKEPHALGPGCAVHCGFWRMYLGCKEQAFAGTRRGLREQDVEELVITGHSMGAVLGYLFALDILTAEAPLQSGLAVKIAAFGSPRFCNKELSVRWQEAVEAYMAAHGENTVKDYLVKAYNDGVPSLPPSTFGYAHLSTTSMYLYHGRLFYIPVSEREHGVFAVAEDALDPTQVPDHPRGGHNYYNGRNWEKIIRRMGWVNEMMMKGAGGWEEEYLSRIAQKERT